MKNPTINIPSLIEGGLDDVIIGDATVFEEVENAKLISCKGLKNFVRLTNSATCEDEAIQKHGSPHSVSLRSRGQKQQIIIFDNHNHALYFWIEAVRKGYVQSGFEVYHIDEHSDLWGNLHKLDRERAINNPEYAWEFTNLSCNVGNYIRPALDSGLVSMLHRIENEHEIDAYLEAEIAENSILNLDLDFFAPEMDFIDEEKKVKLIQKLLRKVKYVTIATSPYFIEQGRAIEKLRNILSPSKL